MKHGLALLAFYFQLGCVFEVATQEGPRVIRLPDPERRGAMSLEEALNERRSVRDFRRDALTLPEVSQILWAAQGITRRDGYRTAPSAGALYPLELYLLVGNVGDLPAGLYAYRPRQHALRPLGTDDLRTALAEAAVRQLWIRDAPAIVVITAVYGRTAGKYGGRAQRYVHMEVGHAAQNVYLEATALGLGTTFVGAFQDGSVSGALGLPRDHAPLGIMPIGRPR